MEIRDLEKPGSRGKKSTGSWIRNAEQDYKQRSNQLILPQKSYHWRVSVPHPLPSSISAGKGGPSRSLGGDVYPTPLTFMWISAFPEPEFFNFGAQKSILRNQPGGPVRQPYSYGSQPPQIKNFSTVPVPGQVTACSRRQIRNDLFRIRIRLFRLFRILPEFVKIFLTYILPLYPRLVRKQLFSRSFLKIYF